MPTVFIVNEPDETRVPAGRASYDTSTSSYFGDIAYIFRADDPPPVRDRDAAIERAHEVLRDSTPQDFLVWAGGDPFGMIIAAAVMSDVTGGEFTYLMWDRMARTYAPVPVKLFEDVYDTDDVNGEADEAATMNGVHLDD
jgi:hypothetical protein